MNALETDILGHMARAFFASAWADMVEENGRALRGEIMDQMPEEIDPAAWHAARTLYADMERANGAPMSALFNKAETVHIESGRPGDRPFNAEMWGHYAAMQSMGHGVGLGDAFGSEVRESVRVPYCEFGSHSLERDYE